MSNAINQVNKGFNIPGLTPVGYLSARVKNRLIAAFIILTLVGLTGYAYWPSSPVDLARGANMIRSGLYASWSQGSVVVLIRHGERCDRSGNSCLGPKDGITRVGNAVSTGVGKSFKALGLTQTDVYSSPSTRTIQTAESIVGHSVAAQDWAGECGNLTMKKIIEHKVSNRNLMLVTHSECIGRLEAEQGYPNASGSEYDSALFISVDARGKPVIRGVMNAEGWKRLSHS